MKKFFVQTRVFCVGVFLFVSCACATEDVVVVNDGLIPSNAMWVAVADSVGVGDKIIKQFQRGEKIITQELAGELGLSHKYIGGRLSNFEMNDSGKIISYTASTPVITSKHERGKCDITLLKTEDGKAREIVIRCPLNLVIN